RSGFVKKSAPSTQKARSTQEYSRHSRQPDQSSTLWIDCISINQADNNEKSWQVQMMRDMIENAQNVMA
ncbi:hypothetical protein K432DRAFT_456297, partial [Lepidopterella palustris CBS 459.81]